MTIQEKSSLAWQFHDHKLRTCLELKQIIPLHLIVMALLGNDSTVPLIALKTSDFPGAKGEPIPMFFSGDAIRCRVENGSLRDDDIFRLTERGEDILYSLEKEKISLLKTDESIKWAKYATIIGTIGVIATVASITISVWLSL